VRPFQRRGPAPIVGRRAPRCTQRIALHAFVLVLALLPVLWGRAAAAQYPRDRATRDEIAHVMANEFGKRRFDAAEAALLGVIERCQRECSPPTLARAWMYVGVVQGSKNELLAARQSFDNAFAEDRAVVLDTPLATPQTAATFEAARQATPERGRTGPLIGAPSTPTDAPAASTSPVGPHRGLVCTPGEREIQTRRPIPFDCHTDAETVRVTLRYREHAGARWETLELQPSGDGFRATLPCDKTMDSGRLELFVVATDDAGDPVDTLGSKNEPLTLILNPNSDVVPAYPGEPPPERCEEEVLCPPEFPGCEDPDAVAPGRTQAALRSKQRLSLHFAADVGLSSGSDVCTSSNTDYDCFFSGTDSPFPAPLPATVATTPGELGEAYPGTDVDGGIGVGTLRVLIEYDHALSERASIAGRLGFAFGGSPTTIDGDGFLPLHLEAMLRYWPRGQWARGLRPYLHFGGGLAEVDLDSKELAVRDCTEEPNRAVFLDCIAAQGAYAPENDPELPVRSIDAYRKLGDVFASAGAGLLVPVSERLGLQLDLNAMLLFPSVGVVLQPSFGLSYGL
jgi:hypothetical protein